MLDELGDVLFQVHFLSLLLEERGAGDLGQVADHCASKLVRRHPHVFGETEAADAAAVLRNWDAIKRDEEGRAPRAVGELPRNLPAAIYARKVQRRAAAAGDPQPDIDAALARIVEEARRLAELPGREPVPAAVDDTDAAAERALPGGGGQDPMHEQRFDSVGELLFAAVAAAREVGVDAELALRAAADRRRERMAAEDESPPGPPPGENAIP